MTNENAPEAGQGFEGGDRTIRQKKDQIVNTIIPDTEEVRQDETRKSTRWVSTIGTCDRFESVAGSWRAGVRERGSGAFIETFTLTAPTGEELSLDDLDMALLARGYVRSSAWQIGSDAGWVAWLDVTEGAIR